MKRNYTQHILLVAIVVFIIVGIANYGGTPSGSIIEKTTRYDVTSYECKWGEGSYLTSGGWHWIGKTSDYTWTLGHLLTRAEAYCKDWTWVCKDINGIDLGTGTQDCSYGGMEGAVCTCAR